MATITERESEQVEMPGRDHALVIGQRWKEACDAALGFLARVDGDPV